LGTSRSGRGDHMQHERLERPCFPHASAPFLLDITTAGE
jgi:hypothetical protein